MNGLKITLEHARRAGYCARGMRRWFEGRDVSWMEFVQHGVSVEWARAQQDAMADRLIEIAEAEHGQR